MPAARQSRWVVLPCARCGKPFDTRESSPQMFCSHSCSAASRWDRGLMGGHTIECWVCGVEYRAVGPASKTCGDERCDEALRRSLPYRDDRVRAAQLVRYHDGVCDACDEPLDTAARPKRGVVDHCHSSGRVRGLIHSQCNLGLGIAEDDQERLFRWQVYLARHQMDIRELAA